MPPPIPFNNSVGLVLNNEGKLMGLDLNRSLRDEYGEICDMMAGTFLVVGLEPEIFASLPPEILQKYTEQFKQPELFASINRQIVSVPVEPENPLHTAKITLAKREYGERKAPDKPAPQKEPPEIGNLSADAKNGSAIIGYFIR